MKNKTKYQWRIDLMRGGDDLNPFYFSIKESNKIIKDCVEDIKDYGKTRKIKFKDKTFLDNEEKSRISKIEIKSLDGLIKGKISYIPSRYRSYAPNYFTSESVNALIYFNSNNIKDVKECNKLIKLIIAIK